MHQSKDVGFIFMLYQLNNKLFKRILILNLTRNIINNYHKLTNESLIMDNFKNVKYPASGHVLDDISRMFFLF